MKKNQHPCCDNKMGNTYLIKRIESFISFVCFKLFPARNVIRILAIGALCTCIKVMFVCQIDWVFTTSTFPYSVEQKLTHETHTLFKITKFLDVS